MGTKTDKFNLNQIVATDTPDWLTTYNEDMAEIERRGLDKATYDPTDKKLDAFRADSHVMTGYVRPTEPETIRQTDTVSSAIGKLETRGLQAGDMRKNTYDKNDDGKVDAAEYADVAGSIPWESVQGRPTTLPNDNAITVKFDGVYVGKYDGSAPLDVNVEADAIGAASLVDGKVPIGQLPASDAIDSDSSEQLATSKSVSDLREAVESVEDGTYPKEKLYTQDEVNLLLTKKAAIAAEMIANRIYDGADLTAVFAAEIAPAPYNGNPWAWIQARIKAANFAGIYVGDYIPFTAGGNAIKAEVAGIDTYYNYGDTAVGHHIDFISRDCWPDLHVFNQANYNNGTTVSPYPWLASDLYAWLNSLAMSVPNAATANPVLLSVNYTVTGVYDKLPVALQSVIVTKRALLPQRHNATTLLPDDNTWGWVNVGKLWIPSEVEVYGCEHWGSKNGHSGGGFQQYPIFSTNMKRVKGAGDGGSGSHWWLLSARGDYPAYFAIVRINGHADSTAATDTSIRVPVCFRIA